ncbi:D-alanyl-D-alanine carboxypeptidase family protein [Clostridium tunisiense]|uniref:D-alanyl-D-alanine carboxypeptidase family protein n=1 Tax=Clostridium tunisiense TaxID=219748 RepID=UPI0002EE79BB|nr:D-alanyl-D-alanine carboxypeptidase family protein [Clostridium tunisiense]
MKKKVITLALTFSLLFSSTALAAPAPDLIGTSAIAVDLTTKEIIYAKNIDEKRQPASITKLMTGLLLAENKKPEDNLTYPEGAKKEPDYSYGLNVHPVQAGETFSGSDAMDILLLYSGNDIAYMIADNVGGSVENFSKLMNEKAKSLNMTNTNFVTPNGLDDNTNDHYTSAYDLTLLGEAVYKNPWVKETIAKKTSEVQSSNGPIAVIENRNKLLGINGNVGGKTGYTTKSGRCLFTIYERNGRTIATVVLNSEYNFPADTKVFEDMEKLVEYSFSAEKQVFLEKEKELKSITLKYKAIPFIGPTRTIKVPVSLHKDITLYNTELAPELNYAIEDISPWKLSADKPVGKVEVKVRNYSESYELFPNISKWQIIKDNALYYLLALLVIITIISSIVIIRIKFKRKKRRRRSLFK